MDTHHRPCPALGGLGVQERIWGGDMEGMLAVSIWWNALIDVQSIRDGNNVQQ